MVQRAGQDVVVDRDAEKRETGHQHAGDGAGLEGNVETACQTFGRCLCGAHVGAHRDMHADEPGRPRKHGADQEADGGRSGQKQPCRNEHDHADDGDRLVLPCEIGLRALADIARDFTHSFISLVGSQN